ncbi:GH16 domain-containing protein [Mycena kentingensis (nom. inval.)]|nr:GH16 domain-containing protein [Mycena kentingensis (nom. inval.)]
MQPISALILLAFPLAALCHPSARRDEVFQSRATFTLKDHYQGKDFLDWDFFSNADPTHGNVNYLTKSEAIAKGLAYVQKDGTTVLAVDDTSRGVKNRDSVRISSPKAYTTGLFIADIWAMPHGPTTWPAYWTVGPNWPHNGEIDLLEGVGESETNQITLHTGAGCTLDTGFAAKFSGKATGTKNCQSGNGGNAGCGIRETTPNAYGHKFNMIAGGVTAHLVDASGIKVWRFPRTDIPADITAQKPDPSTWGKPAALFSSSTCDIKEHFKDHVLTFDTTLCGDLAGNLFPGGPAACEKEVGNPDNFKLAKWMINYVAVYDS